MTEKTNGLNWYAVAVALRIGSKDDYLIKAIAEFHLSTSEEAAEAQALKHIHEAFAELPGEASERYVILDYSAQLITANAMQEVIDQIAI